MSLAVNAVHGNAAPAGGTPKVGRSELGNLLNRPLSDVSAFAQAANLTPEEHLTSVLHSLDLPVQMKKVEDGKVSGLTFQFVVNHRAMKLDVLDPTALTYLELARKVGEGYSIRIPERREPSSFSERDVRSYLASRFMGRNDASDRFNAQSVSDQLDLARATLRPAKTPAFLVIGARNLDAVSSQFPSGNYPGDRVELTCALPVDGTTFTRTVYVGDQSVKSVLDELSAAARRLN